MRSPDLSALVVGGLVEGVGGLGEGALRFLVEEDLVAAREGVPALVLVYLLPDEVEDAALI